MSNPGNQRHREVILQINQVYYHIHKYENNLPGNIMGGFCVQPCQNQYLIDLQKNRKSLRKKGSMILYPNNICALPGSGYPRGRQDLWHGQWNLIRSYPGFKPAFQSGRWFRSLKPIT
jgi:hypothetical protein